MVIMGRALLVGMIIMANIISKVSAYTAERR